MSDERDGGDEQDLAEVFDETNITEDGDDIAHPDMAPNVFDVTRDDEDADEDEERDEDFDPDQASDEELDVMLERDDGVDDDEPVGPDDEDRVTTEDDSPADYQSRALYGRDSAGGAYRHGRLNGHDRRAERRLDDALEDTFPASDPVSISPGAD